MNPVVHFEMLAEDSKRMANFYTKKLGFLTRLSERAQPNYSEIELTCTLETLSVFFVTNSYHVGALSFIRT
jgi:hypothetical protein